MLEDEFALSVLGVFGVLNPPFWLAESGCTWNYRPLYLSRAKCQGLFDESSRYFTSNNTELR